MEKIINSTVKPVKSLWKNTTYVKLFSAQLISLIGTGISSLCLAFLAWDLAGSSASSVIGTTLAIKIFAYVVLAPVFGAYIHKLPCKQVMVFLDLFRATLFFCMPFVTQAWQIYLLMFLINACSAGFTPLYQALLPRLLRDKAQYSKALSFSRIAYDMEQLVSPIVTALLVTLLSFRTLFLLDALTFVLSAILILLCSFSHLPRLQVQRRGWSNLKFGISAYLKNTHLKSLWFCYLATACASAMVIVNSIVYVNEVLGAGESETALVMACVGFGSIVTSFMLPAWLKHKSQAYFMFLGTAIILFAFVLGITTPSWPGYILLCVLLGIGMSCIQTPAGLAITEACSEKDAPAYFAAHFSLTHFWWFFTYLLAGWMNNSVGIANTYLMMTCFTLLALVVAALLYRKPMHKNKKLLVG